MKLFNDTQEVHRVALAFPIGFFMALAIYVNSLKTESLTTIAEYTAYGFVGFFWLFTLLFAAVTPKFNGVLLLRQSVAIIWGMLLQGVIFGTEQAGTMFFNIVSFVSTSALIPFVLGIKYSTIQDWFKNVINRKKKNLAIVRSIDDANHG